MAKDVDVKDKKKDRVASNILLVAVLVLLVYILFATGIIKITSKEDNVINKNEEVTTPEEKTKLKNNDEVVTSLYKSVELGRSYNALRHYYFYSYDSVFAKYMDEAFIKEMAISRLTLTDATKVDANILESQFMLIVGNNATYKNRTFQTQCATFKYDSTLNSYSIIKNTSCDTTKNENYEYFDKIESAYKYSDRIEITTRVGFAIEQTEAVSDGIYQSTGKTIIKKDMDTTETLAVLTGSIDQIKKSIDYTTLSKYKYTFRIDNNKYYFYSVERID